MLAESLVALLMTVSPICARVVSFQTPDQENAFHRRIQHGQERFHMHLPKIGNGLQARDNAFVGANGYITSDQHQAVAFTINDGQLSIGANIISAGSNDSSVPFTPIYPLRSITRTWSASSGLIWANASFTANNGNAGFCIGNDNRAYIILKSTPSACVPVVATPVPTPTGSSTSTIASATSVSQASSSKASSSTARLASTSVAITSGAKQPSSKSAQSSVAQTSSSAATAPPSSKVSSSSASKPTSSAQSSSKPTSSAQSSGKPVTSAQSSSKPTSSAQSSGKPTSSAQSSSKPTSSAQSSSKPTSSAQSSGKPTSSAQSSSKPTSSAKSSGKSASSTVAAASTAATSSPVFLTPPAKTAASSANSISAASSSSSPMTSTNKAVSATSAVISSSSAGASSTASSAASSTVAASSSSTSSSSASITSPPACPSDDNKLYLDPSGDAFRVQCSRDFGYGEQFQFSWVSGMAECVGLCASHNADAATPANNTCQGVSSGGTQCYLKHFTHNRYSSSYDRLILEPQCPTNDGLLYTDQTDRPYKIACNKGIQAATIQTLTTIGSLNDCIDACTSAGTGCGGAVFSSGSCVLKATGGSLVAASGSSAAIFSDSSAAPASSASVAASSINPSSSAPALSSSLAKTAAPVTSSSSSVLPASTSSVVTSSSIPASITSQAPLSSITPANTVKSSSAAVVSSAASSPASSTVAASSTTAASSSSTSSSSASITSPPACPDDDNKLYLDPSGNEFRIQCSRDFAYGELLRFAWVSGMQECVGLCASYNADAATPANNTCQGVSTLGDQCYLKHFTHNRYTSNYNRVILEPKCPVNDGLLYTDQTDRPYKIACNKGIQAATIQTLTTIGSLNDCIDACTNAGTGCGGAVYSSGSCVLKATGGSLVAASGSSAAIFVDSNASTSSSAAAAVSTPAPTSSSAASNTQQAPASSVTPFNINFGSSATPSSTSSAPAAITSAPACPNDDNKLYLDPSGNAFRVQCSRDFGYGEQFQFAWVSGMQECVGLCASHNADPATPANNTCQGVSSGGTQCYLKHFTHNRYSSSYDRLILEPQCPVNDGLLYTDQFDRPYKIACDQNIQADTVQTLTSIGSLNDCIDACTASNTNGTTCAGAVYKHGGACDLKAPGGTLAATPGYSAALVQSS